MKSPSTPVSTSGVSLSDSASTTTPPSRRHRRRLALAVALTAGGTLLAPLPAHAATTSSTTSSSQQETSKQAVNPPKAQKKEDQAEVDGLWAQLWTKADFLDWFQANENEGGDSQVPSEGESTTEGNPFVTAAPYADPTYATSQIAALRGTNPDAAAAVQRITDGGVALWVGDWDSTDTVAARVRTYTAAAHKAGRTPVVVTYAIPAHDCGSYSAGGLDANAYGGWVEQVAAGLKGSDAAVIVEPDAIAQVGQCDGQGDRLGLLHEAVDTLDDAGAAVYLDAGNSGWTGGEVDTIADRLRAAGVEQARGFAVNVSNFGTDADERAYAEKLSGKLDGAHYVIDTSRNGVGGNGEWCNPTGRALGKTPGVVEDDSHQDANLWIKRVGESDGTCNGGPAAGTFWVDYAVDIAS